MSDKKNHCDSDDSNESASEHHGIGSIGTKTITSIGILEAEVDILVKDTTEGDIIEARTRGRARGRANNNNNRSVRPNQCFRCLKNGHWARSCPSNTQRPVQAIEMDQDIFGEADEWKEDEYGDGKRINGYTRPSGIRRSLQGLIQYTIASIFFVNNISMSTIEKFTRPFLNVGVGATKLRFLVDTGACLSCISERAFHGIYKHWTLASKQLPKHLKITGATGQSLIVKGVYTIKMKVLDREVEHDFLVIKNLISDGIIGADFIARHRIQIGGNGRTTEANWAKVESINTMCQENKLLASFATAMKNYQIPPMSIMPIAIKAPEIIGTMALEPIKDTPFGVFESVIDGEKPYAVIINGTHEPIDITKNDQVAMITNVTPLGSIDILDQAKVDTEPSDTIRWKSTSSKNAKLAGDTQRTSTQKYLKLLTSIQRRYQSVKI